MAGKPRTLNDGKLTFRIPHFGGATLTVCAGETIPYEYFEHVPKIERSRFEIDRSAEIRAEDSTPTTTEDED